jgi:hypothetical protein
MTPAADNTGSERDIAKQRADAWIAHDSRHRDRSNNRRARPMIPSACCCRGELT